MTVLVIIFCFIVALIIYFGKYYEQDKKAMGLRKRQPKRKRGDGYFILPFFEEHGDGSPGEIPLPEDEDPEFCPEEDPENQSDEDPDFDG